MASGVGQVAPGMVSKLNLTLDLAFLLLAIYFSTAPAGAAFLRAPYFVGSALAIWIVSATSLRQYDPLNERALLDDLAMVLILVMGQVLLLVGLKRFGGGDGLPRASLFFSMNLPLAIAGRAILRRYYTHEAAPEDILVVGAGPLGRATAADLERRGGKIAGFLSFPGEKTDQTKADTLLGDTDALPKILAEKALAKVYLAGNARQHHDAIQAAIKSCEVFGVPFAVPLTSFRFDRAQLSDQRIGHDGYLHYLPMMPKPSQLALKRLVDIVASGIALLVLLPGLAGVAILIKFTSKGPVFFRQRRVGLHGNYFSMLKFRSMVVDAEQLKARLAALNEQSGPVFKMKNDPRITPIGRFIRKYSIDELPQLLNVLRGDMSIVGPRPPVPPEVAMYQPWQRRRLSVRPGLTCIWQVSGRNQISFEEWMYLDMQYIDNWTLASDFRLILKTIPVVLTGRGAS